jgi:coenzyme F420 biosynthesis associated uncharacterized protein
MASIDWDTTTAVARRFSGDYPLAGTYHERKFALTAPQYVARASDLVAEETGLELPGAPAVGVISRSQWVETNIQAFTALLAPLREAMGESAEDAPDDAPGRRTPPWAGKFMGAELGAVLGFLSKRVLGQYELVLPTGEDELGDSVFFVGANVLAMERQHEFRPSHFRFWVALHETAHRAQFKGVPWMRSYFLGLVDELVDSSRREPGRMARIASEVIDARNHGRDPVDDAGILGLLASHGQREALDKVQALMSLLEGHGHIVMDRIGEREIVDVDRMSRVLTARRADAKSQGMMRLIGMEMKLKQYELGAAFIRSVEDRAGWDALAMAWESPEALPTLAEIEDAESWLRRMGG